MSWNGATDVARWELLAGADAHTLAPIGSANRAGFETAVTAKSTAALVAMRAYDAAGNVLGTSAPVKPTSEREPHCAIAMRRCALPPRARCPTDVQVRALIGDFHQLDSGRIQRSCGRYGCSVKEPCGTSERYTDHGMRRERSAGDDVELVAVDVGGQSWALPLAAVERVVGMVAVSPLPESPAGVRGAINVGGEIVPVLDLDLRIGRPAT